MLRALHIVIWLAAVAYGGVLAAYSHQGFPEQSPTGMRMPYLSDKPVGEDGYYMLTIAWRLGGGQGLTYNSDGATTGIQPLATVLYAGVAAAVRAAGGDRWTFARVMLAVGVLQWLLVAVVMGRMAAALAGSADPIRRERALMLGAVLVLLNFSVFRISTYGLETPLYLLLFCSSVRLALPGILSVRAALTLGLVAGLTVLARIDFLVVLVVFLALEVARARLQVGLAMIVGATAAIVASPWFAVVYAITGQLVPTSGRAQAEFPVDVATALERVSHMATALAQHFSPWLYLSAGHAVVTAVTSTGVAGPVLTLLTLAVGVAIATRGWRALSPSMTSGLVSWLGALGVLFLIYVTSFRPAFFFVRYSAPLLAIVIPLLAIGVLSTIRDRRAIVAMQVAMMAGFGLTAWQSLHDGRVGNPHSISAGLVGRLLAPPAVVGAYQSGVLGYFNENVVNLDGKVNAAALDASNNGTLLAYVQDRGVTHIVEWRAVLDALPGAYFDAWPDCGLGEFGYSVCVTPRDP